MISLDDIHFGYSEDNNVFSGFSYKLKKNEILSVLGNSGCGKTTLLNLISGLLTPKQGTITATDFTYLTQDVTLLSYRTAFENALFACQLRNSLTQEKINETKVLFQQFNLLENAQDKFPQELSGGMQQRVALIQTLLIDTKLYLLDEPFNAIDRATSLTIQNLIWVKFKTNNFSSIIVTHDLEQAILMSDKILILSAQKEKQEIIFDKEFVKLPPQERLNSEYYSHYMLETIKKLGDS